jgi:hypothetical protein
MLMPPEPGLVDHAGSEDVRVVQGADLAVRLPDVAEAGHGVALQVGLSPLVHLVGVVGVQTVVRSELVVDVARPLVDVDVGGAGPDETRRSRRADRVGGGDQGKQVPNHGVRDRRPLVIAQDSAVEVELLSLPGALVAHEEERLVLDDGAAQVRPELVPLEGRLRLGLRVEEVPGVQVLVPIELEDLSVEIVGSGAGGDVHHRPGASPVLCAERRVVDLELGDGVDRGLERDLGSGPGRSG